MYYVVILDCENGYFQKVLFTSLLLDDCRTYISRLRHKENIFILDQYSNIIADAQEVETGT